MAAAAVLPHPADRSKNICEFQTAILEAGVEALKSSVETLMDNFKGKDFQAIRELLKQQG